MPEDLPQKIHDEVLFQENRNLEILKRALESTLVKVFGEGEEAKKFINVSAIPLICKSILDIRETQKEMKALHSQEFTEIKEMIEKKLVSQDAFLPVKNIVYGAVAIILVAVITALVYLVVRH